jgi:hypothetical protein
MTVRLRPHHLLCSLTFIGKGYSPTFVENFEKVIQRIVTDNEPVQVVDGPDDICAPLLNDEISHCRQPSVEHRDHLAAEALSHLLQQPVKAGTHLQLLPPTLDLLRNAFAAGTIRTACHGCQWHTLCDSISDSNFEGTKILQR